MTAMTTLLLIAGVVLFAIGGVMFVVAMFRTSIWWGIGGLVFVPVQIVFMFRHWPESKQPIIVQTAGLVLLLVAALTGGDAFLAQYEQQFSQYMKESAPEQWKQAEEMQSLLTSPEGSVAQVSSTVKNSVNAVAGNPAVNTVSTAVKDTVNQLAPPAAGGSKVIYKCVDAKGHVAYNEQPCAGGKAMALKDNYDAGTESKAASMFDAAKKLVTKDPEAAKH